MKCVCYKSKAAANLHSHSIKNLKLCLIEEHFWFYSTLKNPLELLYTFLYMHLDFQDSSGETHRIAVHPFSFVCGLFWLAIFVYLDVLV